MVSDPEAQCWLVEEEGRLYWELMTAEGSPFDFSKLPPGAACPFRGGLYQLMRNRVLAQALVTETSAKWAELGVCIHPGNDRVRRLRHPVAQKEDALEAYRALLPNDPLREVAPRGVVEAAERSDPSLETWASWVRTRYLLD